MSLLLAFFLRALYAESAMPGNFHRLVKCATEFKRHPIVGLLALVLFLSLGGAFALIGPWAIFVATRVVTKRLGLESPYHEGS